MNINESSTPLSAQNNTMEIHLQVQHWNHITYYMGHEASLVYRTKLSYKILKHKLILLCLLLGT